MTSVYVKTLGCKVNSYDSRVLENQFRDQGYHIAEDQSDADITVINSCSVTETAEKEARYLLRRYRRENPQGLQVITGCYAQINSERLKSLSEVDLIVPNEIKHDLVRFVHEKTSPSKDVEPDADSTNAIAVQSKLPLSYVAVEDNKQSQFRSSITLFDNAMSDQTRAYLKVQDGCNGFCTYCQIPYARGASRSVPMAKVLSEVEKLAALNTPEIVLTGIHVGDYGEDQADLLEMATYQGETPFVSLVREILKYPNIKRLRISSLEPSEVTLPLLEVLAAHPDKVCEHFHLPMQSGSNSILKKMRRTYLKEQYLESVEMIRRFFPSAHMSADVIVGFPGESEADFQETIDFIKSCRLASLHVFSYSKRPNTAAAKLPGHHDVLTIKDRSSQLRSLSPKLYREYASLFLGKKSMVLWEDRLDDKGRRLGKSRHYLEVAAHDREAVVGQENLVELKGFTNDKHILGV